MASFDTFEPKLQKTSFPSDWVNISLCLICVAAFVGNYKPGYECNHKSELDNAFYCKPCMLLCSLVEH
ncbi:hypothetical protein KCV00_g97, partial [Aureobasidium melanogenum]